MLKRILPDQARIGMYVHSFDGKWLSHPFWRTRFVLDSAADVTKVRDAGLPFHIDTALGLDVEVPEAPQPAPAPRPFGSNGLGVTRPQPRRAAPAARPAVQFGKANQERAIETARRTAAIVRDVFNGLQGGKEVELDKIATAVADVAAAVDCDPAIFLSATRLRAKSEQLYMHSVAVCALTVNLGNVMGLSAAAARDLGTGALLHDVGKLALPDAVLAGADQATGAERAELRRHPELGHQMLLAIPDVPAAALDICLNHHERVDGAGYPNGLSGGAISQAAQMVAICNRFDGMTSSQRGRKGLPPRDALTAMMADEGAYDPALLFSFMRSLGVFPTGMLVRLRSNRLAVTLPPLRGETVPRFRAFYSTLDAAMLPYDDVDAAPGGMDGPVSREHPGSWFDDDWSAVKARITSGAWPPRSAERAAA